MMPNVVKIMALPDDHYKRVKEMVRRQKIVVLRQKDLEAHFYREGKQLKVRINDEVQDVIPLSEAQKHQDDDRKRMEEYVIRTHPNVEKPDAEAATDILAEGVKSVRRLMELGVPLSQAKAIVAEALQSDEMDRETIATHLSQAPEGPSVLTV